MQRALILLVAGALASGAAAWAVSGADAHDRGTSRTQAIGVR